jgi:hypothetical protein
VRDERFGEGLPGTVTLAEEAALIIGGVAVLPLCDASRRGELRRLIVGGGDADSFVICESDGADYAWTTLTPASGGGTTGTQTVQIPLGNGVDVIGTGVHKDFAVPTAGIWTKWRLLATKFTAGSTGSMVADLWGDSFANFPPVNADSVAGSDLPTLAADDESESTALTGWDTTFAAGTCFRVNVDSCATITQATLIVEYTPVGPAVGVVVIPIGNGVDDIPDGVWADFTMPAAGIWTKWRLLSTKPLITNGDLVLDIWSQAFADFPAENAQSIAGTDLPTLTAAQSAESSALTGWTDAFAAGDTFRINVDSSTTLKLASLVLFYQRS